MPSSYVITKAAGGEPSPGRPKFAMSHSIRGFVAKADQLKKWASQNNWPVFPLDLGYAFLPDFDRDFALLKWPGFPIAYIETDYFGGVGTQTARYWLAENAIDCGSSEDDCSLWPINAALEAIGVLPISPVDAFAMVGLGRYRSMDRFQSDG